MTLFFLTTNVSDSANDCYLLTLIFLQLYSIISPKNIVTLSSETKKVLEIVSMPSPKKQIIVLVHGLLLILELMGYLKIQTTSSYVQLTSYNRLFCLIKKSHLNTVMNNPPRIWLLLQLPIKEESISKNEHEIEQPVCKHLSI